MSEKQIVLSGIRPTGQLHLGNFLGVLKRFAAFSQRSDYQCYFFVADLHALTTLNSETVQIQKHLNNIILDYLAAGVDPEKSSIFIQSQIPETLELYWYLACLTSVNELERIPTFKDKIRLHPENVNAGLLNYPILMAADILGPQANFVPIGKDQKPHLEMAAELAKKFNRIFGTTFPIPDALEEEMILVPGLDGSGKMGKSEGNTINLNDSPSVIEGKLRKAMTDPARIKRNNPGTPSKCNVFTLHSLVSSNEEQQECSSGCLDASIGCAGCKAILARNINLILGEFQTKRAELTLNQNIVQEVLEAGHSQARRIISKTVNDVKEKIGMIW